MNFKYKKINFSIPFAKKDIILGNFNHYLSFVKDAQKISNVKGGIFLSTPKREYYFN